jgi:hypothetical protein
VSDASGVFSCTLNVPEGPNTVTVITGTGSNTTSGSGSFTAIGGSGVLPVTLNVNLLMEGPYNSTTGLMNTVLNQRGLLPGQTPIGDFAVPTPAGQPYNSAPWNYAGTESLTTYPATVVDWVLVSLRTSAPGAASVTNALQVAGLLHNDGRISFVNPSFSLPSGSYYVVIEHRNHLSVMSPVAVPVVNNVITFDFTNTESYVVNDPPSFGQTQIGNKRLMHAGNGSQVGLGESYDINFFDSLLWQLQSGIFDQYKIGDYNLDADVNADDSVLWNKNNGRYSRIPQR